MRVLLKPGLVVLVAERDDEAAEIAQWLYRHPDHVLRVQGQGARALRFHDLGPRAEACREPLNVSSRATDPAVRLISNFAHTPFELDGATYASVEAFWQGLKFPDETDRRRIAALHGAEAKRAGDEAPAAESFEHGGVVHRVGGREHWALMERACRAKFTQHPAACDALLGTGTRPLTHRMRRDSRSIPGVIMAEIWMKVRARLASGGEAAAASAGPSGLSSAPRHGHVDLAGSPAL